MAKKILCIDIQADSVSCALLKIGLSGAFVSEYEYRKVSVDKEQLNRDAQNDVAAAAKEAYEAVSQKQDVGGAVLHVSFPAENFHIRNIRTPFREKRKIARVLPGELEMLIPFDPENMVFDFQPTANDTDGEVLAVLMKKQDFYAYLSPFKASERLLAHAGMRGFSTARLVGKKEKADGYWAYLEPGEDKCAMFLFRGAEICLIRSFSFQVSRSNHEYPPEDIAEKAAVEVRRTLMYLEASQKKEMLPEFIRFEWADDPVFPKDSDINKLTARFKETFEKHSGIPTERFDLSRYFLTEQKIRFDATVPLNKRNGSEGGIRLGHTLSLYTADMNGKGPVNLHQKPFFLTSLWENHRKRVVAVLVLLTFVLFTAGVSSFFEIRSHKRKIAFLNAEIESIFKSVFPDAKTVAAPLRQMKAMIRNKGEKVAVSGYSGNKYKMIDLIMSVSKNISEETPAELTRMNIGPENMVIFGNTDGYHSVNEIKKGLERSEMIKEVDITSSKFDNNRKRLMFQLNIKFNI